MRILTEPLSAYFAWTRLGTSAKLTRLVEVIMRYTFFISGFFLLVSGCMITPPLEYEGAAVSDIVQRVRCEIAEAVPLEDEKKYPVDRYSWLRDWTAKVDLTLQTVDTAAITASTSYIEPLSKAGQVAQTFTLGTGVSVSGTADRTDKLSFTVSVRELVYLKNGNECGLARERGLLGQLGLREWIVSSLVPIEDGRLFIGYHEMPGKAGSKFAGPGSASPAQRTNDSPSLAAAELIGKIRELKDRLVPLTKNFTTARSKIVQGEKHILSAERYANQAQVHALAYKGLTKTGATTELQSKAALAEMGATYKKVREANRTAELGSAFMEVAKVLIWSAKQDIPQIKRLWDELPKVTVAGATEKGLDQLTDAEVDTVFPKLDDKQNFIAVRTTIKQYTDQNNSTPKELDGRVKDATEFVSTAIKIANEAWAMMPQSAPLDSVGHTLKFTVVANANVSPNWTLVRLRGPSLGNTPFANAQRNRYHTLDIVLGSPATPGGRDLSEEQRRQLFNLRYESARVLVVPF